MTRCEHCGDPALYPCGCQTRTRLEDHQDRPEDATEPEWPPVTDETLREANNAD
jgi:hypothetical protein